MHSVLLIASLILTAVVLYTALNRIFPLNGPISPESLRKSAGVLLIIFIATVGYPWHIVENWEGIRLEYGTLDFYSSVNLWSYPLQGAIFGVGIALFLFMNRSSFAARSHRSDEQIKAGDKKALRRNRIIFYSVIIACISVIAGAMATAPPPAGLPAPATDKFFDLPWAERQAVYMPLAAEDLAERFPDYSNLNILADAPHGHIPSIASVLVSFDAQDDSGNDRHFLSSGTFDLQEQVFLPHSIAYTAKFPPQYHFNDAFSVLIEVYKNTQFPFLVDIKGEILDESVTGLKFYYTGKGTRKTEFFPIGTAVYRSDYDGMDVTQEFNIHVYSGGYIFGASFSEDTQIDVTRIEALDNHGNIRGFINFRGLTRHYTY
ncbi:MAG: hypothetical protein PHW03_04040 [Eubacteriales bacterium]|nr:hypothetical protein [Eubacteriales bacterium]